MTHFYGVKFMGKYFTWGNFLRVFTMNEEVFIQVLFEKKSEVKF